MLHFVPIPPSLARSLFSALLLQRIEDTAETKAASVPAEAAGRSRGGGRARRKTMRAKSKVEGGVRRTKQET